MTPAERKVFEQVVAALRATELQGRPPRDRSYSVTTFCPACDAPHRYDALSMVHEEDCALAAALHAADALLAAPEPETPYSPDFEAFWLAWPDEKVFPSYHRKRGKGAAFRRWEQKRKKGALPAMPVLLARLKAARESKAWAEDGGAYIPKPETWLNQHGWDDAYYPAAAGGRYREVAHASSDHD